MLLSSQRFQLPPFRPATGLVSGHAQTLFAHFTRPRYRPPTLRRERWSLPDGDHLIVDWLPPRIPRAPHLLLLHGLEGSSEASYIAAILRGAHARGWAALAINFRSCAGANDLPRSYHAGDTDDARFALMRLRERAGDAPVCAVAFSLGANILLKMLAEDGARARLAAAVAISAPYDLAGSARALDRTLTLSAAYRLRFVLGLRQKALAKADRFPDLKVDLPRALAARSLRDFDDAFTAPLHGFAGVADYYARASAGADAVAALRVPTLLLSAADDPMVPGEQFPARAAAGNPHVMPALSPRGGHVAFVSGSLSEPRFYAERTALDYLAAQLRCLW